MSLEVSERAPREPHVPLPEGRYTGVVTRVAELGSQPSFDGTKLVEKVWFGFLVNGPKVSYRGEMKLPMVSDDMTRTLGSEDYPSTLRKLVKACRVPLPVDKLKSINLAVLLGKSLTIKLVHGKPRKDGSRWEKVEYYEPLEDGKQPLTSDIDTHAYSIRENDVFVVPPEWIPPYIVTRILSSPEAREGVSGPGSGGDVGEVPF